MLFKLFLKCPQCNTAHFVAFFRYAHYVCSRCGHHLQLDVLQWIKLLCDRGSFHALFSELRSLDPLEFPGYMKKIEEAMNLTKENEAVITGTATIEGKAVAIAVMEHRFIMASMGSVVGEKIARLLEFAAEEKLPVVMIISSGGARMQEGILSLMQMAKVSAAVGVLHRSKMPLFTILTNPTFGGVTASFAMLGDIIIAEIGALIGFAGPRVIQQTIGQNLPTGFQTAEFLLEKGMVDIVLHRKNLKGTLGKLLKIHSFRPFPRKVKPFTKR